jgi:hypothetical protein
MLLVLEVLVTLWGLGALIRGRVDVFGHWIVAGIPAYLIGLLLTCPFTTVFILGFQRGYAFSQQGRPFRWQDYEDLQIVELTLFGIGLLLSGLVALCTARRPAKPFSIEDEWKARRQCGPLDPKDPLRNDSFLPRK